MTAVAAAPLRIVAIGASNTQGWYVGNQGAYPAKLQALLKAKGIDAQVINAGVPFDTTAGMLKRIDSDVPTGTDIVILQPGANDRRFLGTKEQRAANIAAMERRLRNRSIKVIATRKSPFANLRFHPPHGRRPCDDCCYLTTEDHGNHKPSAQ
jgi:acyl-CoA thioesterase I